MPSTVNETRYKVINNNSFPFGLKLPTHDTFVPKNGQAYLTEDEIMYINSSSPCFRNGMILIEDDEMKKIIGIFEENPNAKTDEDFQKILKLSLPKMKAELENITEAHAIRKIATVAKDMDLTQSKVQYLEEKFNIAFGDPDEKLLIK